MQVCFFYLSDGRNYVIEINSRTSWRDCYARGVLSTLRKQPSFRDTTTAFPAKWRLWDERRNAILMTCRYTDLGSASDWSGKFASASQKHYPNCARFSDVISWGNQWWRRQMSVAFLAAEISIRLAPKLLKLLAAPPAKNNTNLPLIAPAKQATNLI